MDDQGEDFERRWRRRFEAWGKQHGTDASIAGWSESGLAARLANFERLWSPSDPPGLWLDAGCGAGTYAGRLAVRGAIVVGTDYSLPSLFKARERLGTAAKLLASDVRALPFADASFDGVLCFGVMQALAEPLPALRELCRVVRPGGEVWLDALNRYSAAHVLHTIVRRLRGGSARMRYDSPWRLMALLNEAGVADVQVHWLPLLPRRWFVLQKFFAKPAMRMRLARLPRLAAVVSHAFVVRGLRIDH